MSRESRPCLSGRLTSQHESGDVVVVWQSGCAHSTDDARQHRGGRPGPGGLDTVDDARDAFVDIFTSAFDQTVGGDNEPTAGLQFDVHPRSILRWYAEGKAAIA